MKKKVNVTVEKTDTGFSAYAEKFAVATTGSDLIELRNNMVEAMNLLLVDAGKSVSPGDIVFNLDLKQSFEYYQVLNAKVLAKRIGMNYTLLHQYIKGRKKPSPAQVDKIIEGVHQVGRELQEVSIV